MTGFRDAGATCLSIVPAWRTKLKSLLWFSRVSSLSGCRGSLRLRKK